MNELLQNLIYVVITVVLPILVKILFEYIKGKTAHTQYATAIEAVVTAVEFTNQTYVDALKKAGTFTEEAQKVAFETAKKTALNLMSADIQRFIEKQFDSLEEFVGTQIEATVRKYK